jgi:hypothetical protein
VRDRPRYTVRAVLERMTDEAGAQNANILKHEEHEEPRIAR